MPANYDRPCYSPKIARDLQEKLVCTAEETSVPVIVRYRAGAGLKLPKAPEARLKRTFPLLSAMALRVPAGQIGRLAADDEVETVWLDFRVHALLDRGTAAIHAPLAWEAGLTGEGVNVAILDTGIDPDHPDFGDRVVMAADHTPHPNGIDGRSSRVRFRASTVDGNGHGTHVAGIAAGDGTASQGLYRGVAPGANLLVAKVLDDEGAGEASDVIAGLEWALAQGAQVACMSLGGSVAGDGRDALSVACDEFAERGLIICVAAGNAGPRGYTIGPPGCAREVITVGAADATRADSGAITVAGFSSRGPTTDDRVKPDILFPGVAITSCRAAGGHMDDPAPSFPDYYVSASGTSMAAPFAAGACALLLQAHPEATPHQIRDMLCQAATPLSAEPNAQGSGLADVAASLDLLATLPDPFPPPPRQSGCLTGLLPPLAWLLSGMEKRRSV